MVRTVTTTVMTLYYREQGSEEVKTATREFVGTSWTQTKMYNDMKKDEVLIPSGATVENITTETKFCTYHLSDEKTSSRRQSQNLKHLVVRQYNHLKMRNQ